MFEYYFIDEEFENLGLLEKKLNHLGADCWELINIEIQKPNSPSKLWKVIATLKRNINNKNVLNG